MSLSLKDYYHAIDIMRTVDDCQFSEQYFEPRDGRPPYLYAALERSVSHDLAPVVAARFAELAVLVGGYVSLFTRPNRCSIKVSVSADILAEEDDRSGLESTRAPAPTANEPPRPLLRHITNEFDDCVSWCEACRVEAHERKEGR